jgi:D-tagatose-1,6-bisphosphate aldolase subunit GatZ/KbaZ
MPVGTQKESDYLKEIVAAQKAGKPEGVYSICSANQFVLEAAFCQAEKDGRHVLIEATSNQVNQFGGYTNMTPEAFLGYVRDIADRMKFSFDRVVLGGDHLGPNVWRNESAASAMAKSRDLVKGFVLAGFTKIHLDASMRCADDPGDDRTPFPDEVVAERAADLCEVAEAAFADAGGKARPPVYVIGTEVPPPGGAQEELVTVQPTRVEDVERTIEVTRRAFSNKGLESAWDRVVAVVVQPGVEFGNESVIVYERGKARELKGQIENHENLVYEAHSTDYQTRHALKEMVEDHFAILKVGPWLTYAFREALFALARIESEWLSGKQDVTLSNLPSVLDGVMVANPEHWKNHYHGTEAEIAYARKYGFSDRSRYYWPHPELREALSRLLTNLSSGPLPPGLLSQYLPRQYEAVRERRIKNTPQALIHDKIMEVTGQYAYACEGGSHVACGDLRKDF